MVVGPRAQIRGLAPCDLAIDARHGRRFYFASNEGPPSKGVALLVTEHTRVRLTPGAAKPRLTNLPSSKPIIFR